MPPSTRSPIPPRLEAVRVSKLYGTFAAVDEVSFAVQRGAIVGLLGPQGAGKTTILGMLLGLIAPSSGRTRIEGEPFRALPRPGQVLGYAPSVPAVHPQRRVLDHLGIHAAAADVPASRAREALALVGLSGVAQRKAATLESGQRQRLGLAAALVGHPATLVIDEPTTGWAADTLAWLTDFLPGFARRGGAVLLASRTLHPVQHLLSRAVIISHGRVVYTDSMDRMRSANRDRLVVACSDPAGLALALAADGVTDVTLRPDGRLNICGTGTDAIAAAASRGRIGVFDISAERVLLEHAYQMLAAAGPSGAPR